jgi:hypothetical protein
MTPDEAKTIVMCKYPDAQHNSDDFDWHWIGRKVLSESFREDEESVQRWLDMPYITDEDEALAEDTIKAIRQEAEDKAWVDAAQKILKETV